MPYIENMVANNKVNIEVKCWLTDDFGEKLRENVVYIYPRCNNLEGHCFNEEVCHKVDRNLEIFIRGQSDPCC